MRFVEDKKYLPLLSYDTVSTAGAVTHVARVVITLLIRMRVMKKTMTMMSRKRMKTMYNFQGSIPATVRLTDQ